MADMKISELDPASALDGSEVLPVVQSGATKKATLTEMMATLTEMPAAYPPAGLPLNNNQIMTVGMHRGFKSTVDSAISSSKPSKAECVAAFKALPLFDWEHDDAFYIRDITGTPKLFAVKYAANGDTTEAGAAYRFWFEELTVAV